MNLTIRGGLEPVNITHVCQYYFSDTDTAPLDVTWRNIAGRIAFWIL